MKENARNQKPKKLRDCGKNFVNYLIKLTREKKLIWKQIIFNAYTTRKNRWYFVTKIVPNNKPYLKIEISYSHNAHFIEGYNYNIEKLNKVINEQQTAQEKTRTVETIEPKNEKEREKLIARAVIFTAFQQEIKTVQGR